MPVVLLGTALAANYRTEARRRGLAVGRSEALLISKTAVEPWLDGRDLSQRLSPSEVDGLARLVTRAMTAGSVLKLRVHDQTGRVVFSDDGKPSEATFDDEGADAARGETVARLIRLNSDPGDVGPIGPESVEVYLPLTAGTPSRQVGVLEIYLPYAPIAADVTAGLHNLYRALAFGLAVLYVVLFVISVSVGRGLRREARRNAFLARHDVLTGLPNRAHFRARAAEALTAATEQRPVAVAVIDIDRFEEVNDTVGYENGDHVLTALAVRLAEHVGRRGDVARLGGDEFGVILPDVFDAHAELVALRNALDEEVEISGLPLSVHASIGYVVAPRDGVEVDKLLRHAEVATHAAKELHANALRYEEARDGYDATNLVLLAELRRAIAADELVLHYQPKITMADGSSQAIEALVRWEHPTLGVLPPDRFIGLAERTDVIDHLTAWVLRRALTDLHALGPRWSHVAVAVNISARNLSDPRFVVSVLETLTRVGVDATRLIVEITETALLSDPPRAATALQRLASAGVSVSLDDFGTGQTSLAYLAQVPLDELKIDKSFVIDMHTNDAHRAIVRSVVDLGHNLGLRVVGEGVETEDAQFALRETGCDVAQGYFFARPMPYDQLSTWLGTRVARSTSKAAPGRQAPSTS